MKRNKFKAVIFMRKQREELGRLHIENPTLYHMQLKEIHAKYGVRKGGKEEAQTQNSGPKQAP
jgi:P pilus assembly chaperone PapD